LLEIQNISLVNLGTDKPQVQVNYRSHLREGSDAIGDSRRQHARELWGVP